MNSNIIGRFEIAESNGYYFTDVEKDDVLIRTGTSNQNIVLGAEINKVSAMNISDTDILFNRVIRSCNLAPVQIYNVRVLSNNEVQLDALRTATTVTSNDIHVHSHLRMLPGISITDSSSSNVLRLQGVTLCNDRVIASALLPTSSNGTVMIASTTFTSNIIDTHRINVHTITTSNILFPNDRLIVPALTTDSLSLGSDITYTRPVFRVLASTDDSNDMADGITFSNDGTLIARRLRLLEAFETQTSMGIFPGLNTSNLIATKLIQAALSNVTVETSLVPTLAASASNRPMVNLGSASNPFDNLFIDQRGGITLGVGSGSNYLFGYNSNTEHVYLMGAQSDGGVVDVARLQLGLSNFGSRTLELSVDETTGYLKTSTDSILPSVNLAAAPSGSYKVGLNMNPSALDTSDTLQVNGGVSVIGDIRATGHIHLPGYSNDGLGNRIFRSAGAGRYFEFQQSTNATPLVRLTEGGQMTLGLNSTNRDDSQLDPGATVIVHGGLQVTKGDVRYTSGDLYVSGDIFFNRTKKLGGTDEAGLLGPDYLYLTSNNAMVFDTKSASSTTAFRFAQSNGLEETDWMRINGSNGYVGLFTNTPSERLEVASGNLKVPQGSVAIGSNLDVGCNVFIGARSNGISLHTQPGLLHVRNAADSNPSTVVVRSIAFKSSTTDTLTLPETRSDIIELLQESIVALQARVGLLEAQLATLL